MERYLGARRRGATFYELSSLFAFTAVTVAIVIVVARIAVLRPAGEGNPIALFTSGSIRKERGPPQPLTAGASHVLPTSSAPLERREPFPLREILPSRLCP